MIVFNSNTKYKNVFCILIFLLLPLIFFWDGNLPPNLIENGDGLFYYLSEFSVSAKVIKAGELPLWDPYRFCGFPLLGDLEPACLYPPNLLFLFLQPVSAFNLSMYLHYTLAGILTFCYMRILGKGYISSLFSGIVYMFSGFLVARMGHVVLQNTVVWVPLVFLCIEKINRGEIAFYLPLGMLSIALQILASFLQGAVYTTFYVLIYIAFFIIIKKDQQVKRRLVLCGILMILGATLLALVQIIPTFELSLMTPRKEINYEFFASHSLEPYLLPILTFPNFYGGNSYKFYPIYYWGDWNLVEMTGYCGILTLCFAMICFLNFRKNNQHVVFWSIVTIVAFSLSLGEYNPLYKLFYFIPVYNKFRSPVRHLFMFDFSLAILGGMCLDFICKLETPSNLKRSINYTIICIVLISVMAIILGITFQFFSNSSNENLIYNFSFQNPAIYIPLLIMGVTLIFLLFLRINKHLRLLFVFAPLLIFLDLFSFGHFFNPTWKRHADFNNTIKGYDSVKYLLNQNDIYSYRILSCPSIYHLRTNTDEMLSTLFPNSNSMHEIKSVNGSGGFVLDDYFKLLGMNEYGLADFDWLLANNRIISMLNAKYIVSNTHQPEKVVLNKNGSGEDAIFSKWVNIKPNAAYQVYFEIETDNINKGELLVEIIGHNLGGHRLASWKIPVEEGQKEINREFKTSTLLIDEFYLNVSNLSSEPIVITKLGLIELGNRCNILFNAKFTASELVANGTYTKKFEKGYLTIFENTKVLPRFNLLAKVRTVRDVNEAIHILRNSKDFNPSEEALVECKEMPLLPEEGHSDWSVIKNRYNETTIQTSSAGNKLLVVSESYYPGWKVYIDGKEEKILRTNAILRGIFVPKGEHIIRMVYDPLSFKIGLIISGLAWIGLAIWFIIIFVKNMACMKFKQGVKMDGQYGLS